jgi:hypothetical protein
LFSDFLTKPDSELVAGFSDLVVLAAQGKQQQLIRNLEIFGPKPEWWAEDVYAAIEWLNEYIKIENFWIPKIFRESTDPQNDFFSYCRSFSGLLGNWEKIYEEAKTISPAFLEENRQK